MAGQDQSARLQGLLSGIAGSVGELGAGGEWTSNAVRTAARPDFMAGSFGNPEFDTNNVDNLDAMANWASRNGYEDQAKQYMALSYQLKEKEAQEAKDAALGKTMAEATQASSAGQLLGAGGDLGGVDATIAVLNKRLSDPEIQKNPMAVEALQREISTLQSQRPDFEAKNVQAIAQGVAKMDQNIAALNPDDDNYATKKANFEAARSRFLEQPLVEEAYEGNKLRFMELNNKKMDAMWKNQSPAIIKELSDAGTDLTKIAAIEDRYTQFAPQIIGIKGEMIRQAREMEELLSDKFDVKQLPTRIRSERERIEASAMSDREKDNANKLLDDVQTRYDSGYALQGAVAQFATAQQNNNQIINNSNAAEAGVERQRKLRAVVAHEKAMQTRVSEADVVALAELQNGGKEPNEDQIKAARLKLEEELNDYRYRTAIASGREDPQELDADDKKQLGEMLKNGDYGEDHDIAVMRATYDLIAQGYEKEGVVTFLKKELPKGAADRAEDIYNDMWADLQSQDEQTATPAEVAADPLRREPGFRWLDRATEHISSKYEGFLQRRSETLPARPPRGPSIVERQRANLSPSLGPLNDGGEPTKLRQARDNMRTGDGYPYPGGITLKKGERQPYIYRTYR